MKPYLLVSTRPEEEALDSEYQAYSRATGLSRDQLELAEFDLVGLPPINPGEYSGVFIAGSPYGGSTESDYVPQRLQWVRDELRELLAALMDAGTPLLVTGNAVPVLTRVLGGNTTSEDGELATVAEIEVTREAAEDPLMADLPDTFPAYANHSEAVGEMPEGAVRLARSLNTRVEMYRANDKFYAVQFNPELDAEQMRAQIQRYTDAGDSGMGDLEELVSIGRHSANQHTAGRILKNFAEHFGSED